MVVPAPINCTGTPVDQDDLIKLSNLGGIELGAVEVADITNPTELNSVPGSASILLLAYETGAGVNKNTLYAWDSAVSGGADTPWVVASTSGYWIALGGNYNAVNVPLIYDNTTVDIVLDNAHTIIEVTVAGKIVTLPTAVGIKGKRYTVDNSSDGNITVNPDGAETIEGELTWTMPINSCMQLFSNGVNWRFC